MSSAADMTLPSRTRAASQARMALTAVAPGHELVEDGRLLVTEAVANAVEHTDSADVRILIRHDELSGLLVCAVRDTGTGLPCPDAAGVGSQAVARPAAPAEDGRGLQLIEELSAHWGCEVDAHGKWVWFALDPETAGA
ncbi:ATP-binding protein [Streptacidiphilus carbonis]|jgi:anti-sigma regulatory factor (Ser/Thr protein kinase)|uniref:ATP-binding protein n=1 Tax=Streptacidiphilus carbonis TaxID=105422 RepID=UPI0005A99D0B|nr:ATP-binding protein [Streptacidiphilus carbonis]